MLPIPGIEEIEAMNLERYRFFMMKKLTSERSNLKIMKVYGAPGCGKTSTLINITTNLVKSKQIEFDEFLYVSFTNAAVDEANERAKIGLPKNYRTIHSIAYQLCKQKYDNFRVVVGRFINSIGRKFGFSFYSGGVSSGTSTLYYDPLGQDDVLLLAYHYFCNTSTKFASLQPIFNYQLDTARLVKWIEVYTNAKQQNNLMDFNDMLYAAYTRVLVPENVKALIVDESQDLSLSQLCYILKIVECNPEMKLLVFGYDPQQSIYGYAGTSPYLLNDLKAEEVYLRESHRVPENIISYAREILPAAIEFHHHKKQDGLLDTQAYFKNLAGKFKEELQQKKYIKTFILSRSNYITARIAGYLNAMNIPYGTNHNAKDDERIRRTVQLIYIIMNDIREINYEEFNHLAQNIKVTYVKLPNNIRNLAYDAAMFRGQDKAEIALFDLKKKFNDYLNEKTMNSLIYNSGVMGNRYYALLKQTNDVSILDNESHIKLLTMHSSKGKEADRVVILPHMPKKIGELLLSNPAPEIRESENRLLYVATTRAKKELHIVTKNENVIYGLHKMQDFYNFPLKVYETV